MKRWPNASTVISDYKSMLRNVMIGMHFAGANDCMIRIRPDMDIKWLGELLQPRQWQALRALKERQLYRCAHAIARWPRFGIINTDACFLGKAVVFRRFVTYWHDHIEQLAEDPSSAGHPEWSMGVVAQRLNMSFPKRLK